MFLALPLLCTKINRYSKLEINKRKTHSIQDKQRLDNSKFLIDKSRSICASVSRRFDDFNIPKCDDKSFRGA